VLALFECLSLPGPPAISLINQQLATFRILSWLKNSVARRCEPVTAFPTRYEGLQTVPRNTSPTRLFPVRSHWSGTETIGLVTTAVVYLLFVVVVWWNRKAG
jgi:hypothetical protein